MPFIRVKSKGGPAGEFYVGVEEATVNADLYVVVDKEPVEFPLPIEPLEPETVKAPKTSVGDPEKENQP
jgi:hypothetical protein